MARCGLDEIDQKIMLTILEKYGGGPMDVNTVAASIDEEADAIERVYEPYLVQLGFIDRTPRGRVATDRAFEYFLVPRKLGYRFGCAWRSHEVIRCRNREKTNGQGKEPDPVEFRPAGHRHSCPNRSRESGPLLRPARVRRRTDRRQCPTPERRRQLSGQPCPIRPPGLPS
jgi:hypothetical protein